MDKAVIKYYRMLLKTGFAYAGSFENPSILLDTVSEDASLCSQVAGNSLHLYIDVDHGVVARIRYLCTCDPTVNVVIEVLCKLVEGKTLAEAKNISVEAFSQAIGSQSEEYLEKARQAKEFLNKGIAKLEAS